MVAEDTEDAEDTENLLPFTFAFGEAFPQLLESHRTPRHSLPTRTAQAWLQSGVTAEK
jgi:hypothetical protein